jgi:hypothetical protein
VANDRDVLVWRMLRRHLPLDVTLDLIGVCKESVNPA